MLGKFVRVCVTKRINDKDPATGLVNRLNFGRIESGCNAKNVLGAYIMGIDHPVRNFDGRVIAIIRRKSGECLWVVAPKSTRFIVNDIRAAIAYAEGEGDRYSIDCLYESSCGAVVYRMINGELRYLLIKNKRSANWGFPKGHIEPGETQEETAMREVLEETGVHIHIHPGFVSRSEYTIQGKVEKSVAIFVAGTTDTQTVIQQEEIEDYIWLNYQKAWKILKFENDRTILEKANNFLIKIGVAQPIPEVTNT
ncbi:MAG: NUDIX domain-containing protein [Clostridia bacterium]|nr:NUDIX domain-containing protein [Clostridia bacterium]